MLLIIELAKLQEVKEIPDKTKEQNLKYHKSGENSETIKSNIKNIYIFMHWHFEFVYYF